MTTSARYNEMIDALFDKMNAAAIQDPNAPRSTDDDEPGEPAYHPQFDEALPTANFEIEN